MCIRDRVLLVHDDLSNRRRYLNARSALMTLLELGVVPVINENDTVATEEIRFGDNDTLAAMVANLIDADVLVILTDQPGLFARDPRLDPAAPMLHHADANDEALEYMAGASAGNLGRGGMSTKVRAARLAARSGADTVIVGGRAPGVLLEVAAGKEIGTYLYTQQQPLAARKQWLAGQLQVRGRLVLDEGAVRVLRESGRSLLPVGVREVGGGFPRGGMGSCVGPAGGRGASSPGSPPCGSRASPRRSPASRPSRPRSRCCGPSGLPRPKSPHPAPDHRAVSYTHLTLPTSDLV